jgi:transposase
MQVATIGLDLAKHVFQIHGIDVAEKVVVRKQLRRSQVIALFEALPPCLQLRLSAPSRWQIARGGW